MRIWEIAQARVRYGYRKILALLQREGWKVGRYLVYRFKVTFLGVRKRVFQDLSNRFFEKLV
jgi:putative transposase